MKKYWLNTNESSINKAFMTFARHNFSKYKGCVDAETYAEINKEGALAYVYEVSNHFQSSWSNSDVLTLDSKFSKDKLEEVVRFYVSLVIPRLKKQHVIAISNLVIRAMSDKHHSYYSDWYTCIGYNASSISLGEVVFIATDYLKSNFLYREKNEFVKNG